MTAANCQLRAARKIIVSSGKSGEAETGIHKEVLLAAEENCLTSQHKQETTPTPPPPPGPWDCLPVRVREKEVEVLGWIRAPGH